MSDCPSCGDAKADLVPNQVYCPNPVCPNFDSSRLEKVLAEVQSEFDKRLDQVSLNELLPDYYD